ncbi:MAG: DNA polymerase III subunit delta [Bryobacterales bacterium]|nr:DNA polymerase III subunit delta [Bryobacterales bacterium]MBV9400003.1 DNA polymerase III subunit delta [Bryobacterales bacterium]
MTPDQFLDSLKRKGPETAYLFIGPEAYNRERCRRALIDAVLPPDERESGLTRHDLDQSPLAVAIDDARSLSLFAARRVIRLGRAEAALPKGKSVEAEEEGGATGGTAAPLEAYLRDPSPGTVLVIESSRYEFDGEDKARLERVQKFYSAVPAQVEFRRFSPEMARALAQSLARSLGVQLGLAELALLIEATGGEASRIAVEIEKLKLFAGDRKVTAEDIAALIPDAQTTTIFALVNALGRGDRIRALECLDTLTRAGEYMPLALTFLATQFRMALTAREANLRGPGDIQSHFNRLGVRIWPERARQIAETMQAFPKERLVRAVAKLFDADRGLRDARPDDRIVMEEMVLDLTRGPSASGSR